MWTTSLWQRWCIAGLALSSAPSPLSPSYEPIVHGLPGSTASTLEGGVMAPEPGQEMKRLAFLLGTWKAADTYAKSTFAPNGGSGSGTYKTEWGPGRLSLLTDYHYRGPHGESTGHQVITWDPRQNTYVGYVVTSTSPGATLLSGNWEGTDLVLSGEFEFHGTKVGFKEVFSDITESSILLRQYNRIEEGPSQLFGTTRFTRM